MSYTAKESRYDGMVYRRCGNSGLLLPAISLGLWHNFGYGASYETGREMILGSFDLGITHFDLANNYGPPPGSAEESFGKILSRDLKAYRDELIISSKAGYRMWPGPYGEWGSRKYLVSSLDQSLKRMGLDYVDIFYHHRPDPDTPLDETLDALAHIVHSGKALYVGISNYNTEETRAAIIGLRERGIRPLIHQMRYSMLVRENEKVLDVLEDEGVGGIAFSPLAQGILTGKYSDGIPAGSRADNRSAFLTKEKLATVDTKKIGLLSSFALTRGQSLTHLALSWALRRPGMCSLIVGASSLDQIKDNLEALKNLDFGNDELERIEKILAG